jgi:hypothetical protein
VVVETEDGTMVWDDNVTRVSHEFYGNSISTAKPGSLWLTGIV